MSASEAPARAPSPPARDPDDLPTLPVGARVLLVGPANPASTRVQRALLDRRVSLDAQRVEVRGGQPSITDAVRAVAELDDPITGRPPGLETWRSLVRSIERSPGDRVVLASSTFAELGADAIARVSADLGPVRTHAVIMLQPLAEVLADRWLRAVEAGERATFDTWLEEVLPRLEEGRIETIGATGVPGRHLRDDELVARWVEALGADHVTVLVSMPDQPPDLGAVERLTGLGDGTLATGPDPVDRPLTRSEAELIRSVNELAVAEGLAPGLTARAVRFGAAPYLRVRGLRPDEGAVRLPAWAEERVRSIAAAQAAAIGSVATRVVGELDGLAGGTAGTSDGSDTTPVPPDLAATAAIGVLLSAGLVAGAATRMPRPLDVPASAGIDDDPYVPRPVVESLALARVSTASIATMLAGRVIADGVAWLAGRLRRRPRAERGGPADPLEVPLGTRLVHIGPFKTGTTSLQAAFHVARDAVSAQGVHYTGPTPQPTLPVLAVTGRTQTIYGATPPPMRLWRRLVREMDRAREPRVVLSSEYLSEATDEGAARIVHDLGDERVHVVVTLRPLTRILTSQWQQMVQSGLRTGYDDWLTGLFERPDPASTFWRRHRHDELVARWANAAGTANVTVVAVDDLDHAMVLRVFERLTGLRPATLSTPADRTNRSLTRAETEAVRQFNQFALDARVPPPMTAKVMRYGSTAYMKLRRPATDEQRIETPSWALAQADAVAREMVDAIASSGVRVVGDLEAMAEPSTPTEPAASVSPALPADAAARLVVGVLLASGMARGAAPAAAPADVASTAGSIAAIDPGLLSASMRPESLATPQIGSAFVKRAKAAAGYPVWSVRRRLSLRRRLTSGEAG